MADEMLVSRPNNHRGVESRACPLSGSDGASALVSGRGRVKPAGLVRRAVAAGGGEPVDVAP